MKGREDLQAYLHLAATKGKCEAGCGPANCQVHSLFVVGCPTNSYGYSKRFLDCMWRKQPGGAFNVAKVKEWFDLFVGEILGEFGPPPFGCPCSSALVFSIVNGTVNAKLK